MAYPITALVAFAAAQAVAPASSEVQPLSTEPVPTAQATAQPVTNSSSGLVLWRNIEAGQPRGGIQQVAI